MKKFVRWFLDKLSLHCPDCGGAMRSDFLDMEADRLVYKCNCCGKRWI